MRATSNSERCNPPGLPPHLAAYLRALEDACTDAIIGLDSDGFLTTFNRAAARLIGPDVLRPGTALDGVFADSVRWASLLSRGLAGEAVEGVPMDVLAAHGRPVPTRVALVPVQEPVDVADGPHAPVGATVVIRDLSEYEVAQQTLARSERRVRRTEALALTGSFVVDAALGTMQWSEAMHVVHGTAPETFEVTVAAHLALIHPDDRSAAAQLITRGLAGEQAPGIDLRVIRPDGEPAWVFLAVEPLLDAAGTVLGVSGVCQDISARVASEHALQEALAREQSTSEELRRIDKLKDEFLATVSHELRTPLTSIAGFAALLTMSAPEHSDLIERIERNAVEMHRLIQGLLDQARLESGRVQLEPHAFLLAEATREVLADNGLISVDTHVAIDDAIKVFLDRDSFTRILGNLIGNAAKYAPGSPVSVSARIDGDFVSVSVTDHGPGIAREHQEGLFDPFYRAPGFGGATRGTGFGLAIVRRYVELQGGRVWVNSAAGDGARFSFTIPLAREDAAT